MPLTQSLIRKAKPREKPYKLYDFQGLCLLVNLNGSRCWRFNYRFGGRQKTISFGGFPEISLEEAREKRDEARAKVKAGIDPSEERREAKRNATIQTATHFRLDRSPSGDLTIMTSNRRITLTMAQTEALRAFLIAVPVDHKEESC